MFEPLVPARLAFDSDGTPFSEAYQDVYHSAAGGPAQARHVFLGGNDLPGRWRGEERFVVLETGFGLGINFLATWQAWRGQSQRPRRLHFVSLERHPFDARDLAQALERYPEFGPLARVLVAQWPLLVPGMHRLFFENDAVVLTLAFGDAARLLPQLRLSANAIFLDGFAPDRNPELWTPALCRAIARRSAPEATLATWSVAREVRQALEVAGFRTTKRRGFAAKREMTVGGLAPHLPVSAPSRAPAERRAIVIGAGIAGASVSERLCGRGWQVALLEGAPDAARGASGNLAGAIHPVVTRDDNRMARLTRAGTLHALRRHRLLEQAGLAIRWNRCGALQLARDARESEAQVQAVTRLRFPADYVRHVSREDASERAGVALGAGGLWFEDAGWLQAPSLIRALLTRCGEALQPRYGAEVASLERHGEHWRALDGGGRVLAEAPQVVLANAERAPALVALEPLRLRRVRGQLSYVPADAFTAPRVVVLRGGSVLPPIDGQCAVGASYDLDDCDPQLRSDSHAGNLERLERIVPGAATGLDPNRFAGRVAFRAVAPDRLPLVGALPQAGVAIGANLGSVARHAGLHGAFGYGSRGLVWAVLAAELLACQLEGEPLPLEGDLIDAFDPARFLLRSARRGR